MGQSNSRTGIHFRGNTSRERRLPRELENRCRRHQLNSLAGSSGVVVGAGSENFQGQIDNFAIFISVNFVRTTRLLSLLASDWCERVPEQDFAPLFGRMRLFLMPLFLYKQKTKIPTNSFFTLLKISVIVFGTVGKKFRFEILNRWRPLRFRENLEKKFVEWNEILRN